MSLPADEMVVTVKMDEMTVDDLCLLEEFATGDNRSIRQMRKFLVGKTSWTNEQVGKLTLAEMMDVFKKVLAAITEGSIPKEIAPG